MSILETVMIALSLLPAARTHQVDPSREIVAAVESTNDLPLDPEASAVLLLTMAWHESGLRADVATCRIKGAAGELGLWQIMPGGPNLGIYTPAEVCADLALQARLALGVLTRARRQGATIGDLCRAYTSGDARRASWQARDREATFRRVYAGLKKKRS